MSLNKRNQAQIERRLVKHLTDACETAKGQIPGFVWLTHSVDFEAFPASLKVVWAGLWTTVVVRVFWRLERLNSEQSTSMRWILTPLR